MGILSNIFSRRTSEERVGGMEDFMTLVRVYFQAAIAAQVGITNLAAVPDLRVFKTTFRVPTQGNKLGVGERVACRKMMQDLYGMSDLFFKEIDQSIRRRVHKVQDVQVYLLQFQNFTQEIMMLTGNLMKFKLRLPSFFKGALRSMTQKTVHDIFNKNDYSDAGVIKSVLAVRKFNNVLGFSEDWTTDFVFHVVMLAKKEPKPQDDDQ